ncbi:MAG: GCN5-related N-acetyltransferase [Candidatus Solibacter sp.]|nr:GCN5-related N-acetyltransferase [Candidatus Solibacter sp.]
MGQLEYIPATRRVLRHLSSDPQDFADEHGIRLHELSQSVAQHSLEFMRTFSLETPAHWFGYLVVEGESQQMVGTCSFKGPPVDYALEIAYFTFPGFEGRGIGTAMARFLLERAAQLRGVRALIAHTRSGADASTRILGKIGMELVGTAEEDGATVWLWRKNLETAE